MSHTTMFDIAGFKGVSIIHNSDWSGDVTIVWKEDDDIVNRTVLPGKLLLGLSAEAARVELRDRLIAFLEGEL
jgi:hypothetical protein